MRDGPALNGWVVLDKPVGLGSTQAVSAVKRALREGGYAKVKVGHGGTLDPLASGVLPIALGEATKLAGRLLDGDKVYEFTVAFGSQTDTLDLEGRVVATSDVRPTAAEARAVLPRFTGPINQVPPAYSALKVDGERAYDLARAGHDVVLATRSVTVHSLAPPSSSPSSSRGGGPSAQPMVEGLVHPPAPPPLACGERSPSPSELGEDEEGRALHHLTLVAHVSKGTYIRSLARDLALALGTVGHVTHLRRTRAGPFPLSNAISLDKLAELGQARALEQSLLPLRAGLDDIPALSLTPEQAGALRQGRVLIGTGAADGATLATLDDVPVALVECSGGAARVVRGFNL